MTDASPPPAVLTGTGLGVGVLVDTGVALFAAVGVIVGARVGVEVGATVLDALHAEAVVTTTASSATRCTNLRRLG